MLIDLALLILVSSISSSDTCSSVTAQITAYRATTIKISPELNSDELRLGFQEIPVSEGTAYGYYVDGKKEGLWLICSDHGTERTKFKDGEEIGPIEFLAGPEVRSVTYLSNGSPVGTAQWEWEVGKKVAVRRELTDVVNFVVHAERNVQGVSAGSKIFGSNLGLKVEGNAFPTATISAFSTPDADVPIDTDNGSKLIENIRAAAPNLPGVHIEPISAPQPYRIDLYRSPIPGRFSPDSDDWADRHMVWAPNDKFIPFDVAPAGQVKEDHKKSAMAVPPDELSSPRSACTGYRPNWTEGDPSSDGPINNVSAAALALTSEPAFMQFVSEIQAGTSQRTLNILRFATKALVNASDDQIRHAVAPFAGVAGYPSWLSDHWKSVGCRRAHLYFGDYNLIRQKDRVTALPEQEKLLIAFLAGGPYSPEELAFFNNQPDSPFVTAEDAASKNFAGCYGLGACPDDFVVPPPSNPPAPEDNVYAAMGSDLRLGQRQGNNDGIDWWQSHLKDLQSNSTDRIRFIDSAIDAFETQRQEFGRYGSAVTFSKLDQSPRVGFPYDYFLLHPISPYRDARNLGKMGQVEGDQFLRFLRAMRRAAIEESPPNITNEVIDLEKARSLLLAAPLPAETIRILRSVKDVGNSVSEGEPLFEYQSDDVFRITLKDTAGTDYLTPGSLVALSLVPDGPFSAQKLSTCSGRPAICTLLSMRQVRMLLSQLTFVARVSASSLETGFVDLTFRCGNRCRRVGVISAQLDNANDALKIGSAAIDLESSNSVPVTPNILNGYDKWFAVTFPLNGK